MERALGRKNNDAIYKLTETEAQIVRNEKPDLIKTGPESIISKTERGDSIIVIYSHTPEGDQMRQELEEFAVDQHFVVKDIDLSK
jgi:hypothetical protein